MKVMITDDPDLNLLDKQGPDIYGNCSFDESLQKLCHNFTQMEVGYYQGNIEGELTDKLQEVGFSYDGIVLSTGAYTHTSIALLDYIHSLTTPVIEVHISDVRAQEEFRHKSMISLAYLDVIAGFGLNSYELAIEAVAG